jgi:hypothetical protein
MEILPTYCESHKKKKRTHTQCVCSMRKVFSVKAGGAQNHQCAVLGHTISLHAYSTAMFPRRFCWRTHFWLRKITTDPHIPAHVNTACPENRYPKIKNVYLRTDFIYLRIHTSSTRNNAWHDLTLITTVANFVGTGRFLIRHSNGHTK